MRLECMIRWYTLAARSQRTHWWVNPGERRGKANGKSECTVMYGGNLPVCKKLNLGVSG